MLLLLFVGCCWCDMSCWNIGSRKKKTKKASLTNVFCCVGGDDHIKQKAKWLLNIVSFKLKDIDFTIPPPFIEEMKKNAQRCSVDHIKSYLRGRVSVSGCKHGERDVVCLVRIWMRVLKNEKGSKNKEGVETNQYHNRILGRTFCFWVILITFLVSSSTIASNFYL